MLMVMQGIKQNTLALCLLLIFVLCLYMVLSMYVCTPQNFQLSSCHQLQNECLCVTINKIENCFYSVPFSTLTKKHIFPWCDSNPKFFNDHSMIQRGHTVSRHSQNEVNKRKTAARPLHSFITMRQVMEFMTLGAECYLHPKFTHPRKTSVFTREQNWNCSDEL